MSSTTRAWRIREEALLCPDAPFGIMGVLNVTPDSFYEPSRAGALPKAIDYALSLRERGADILDLGGESTRPLTNGVGASPVAPKEERARIHPLFCAVQKQAPDTVISIDTWHSETAAHFLDLGAAIINDISGGLWDPEMLPVVAQYKPGYVLTYAQNTYARMHAIRDTDDIVDDALSFFEAGLSRISKAGLAEDHVVLDPGIGFGMTVQQTVRLLANIDQLTTFGRPLLIGIAEKRFLNALPGLEGYDRVVATQIATALLLQRGVFWHRVHHVARARQALLLSSSISQ
ncbi:MAG: dihydropteroate synthase [Desulfovibrionaceae bacterium]|nr:dihydropteroate synthase [Desulfovibrionaceae bacterium]